MDTATTEHEKVTPEHEKVTPELVSEPGGDVEVAAPPTRASTEIEAAADAALVMPGIAGRDEFLSLCLQAKLLSMSGAAPSAVRDNPHVALHIAMVGRDLGISPSAAIELIDVIESGGKIRLSLSPQLLNGQLRRLGLGSVKPWVMTADRCVAVAFGPGGIDPRCAKAVQQAKRDDVDPEHVDDCSCDVIGDTEFTWDDALMAGLVGADCKPGVHSTKCGNKQSDRKWRCNQGYITYPKRMMWWRASGFCTDDYFPEAGLGLYTAEELGALVDENGRAIDVESIEVPEGFEDKQEQARREAEAAAVEVDHDAVWELQTLVAAMPDEQRAQLRERFSSMPKLKGHRLSALPRALVPLVQSIVRGLEAGARREGWDRDAAVADVERRVAESVIAAATGWAGRDDGGATDTTENRDAQTPTVAQETPGGDDATDHSEATSESSTATRAPAESEREPQQQTLGGGEEPASKVEMARRTRDLVAATDPAVVDRVVEEVKAMGLREVRAQLGARQLDREGENDVVRMRLTIRLLEEAAKG